MKTSMLIRARRNWNSEYVSRETNRLNQRNWIRSIRHLGDKWLLAKPVERVK